jgi:hypothetical protein
MHNLMDEVQKLRGMIAEPEPVGYGNGTRAALRREDLRLVCFEFARGGSQAATKRARVTTVSHELAVPFLCLSRRAEAPVTIVLRDLNDARRQEPGNGDHQQNKLFHILSSYVGMH